MATQNLGNVRALIAGTTAPTNTNLIWLDTNLIPARHKAYNTTNGLWELLSASAGEANTASNLTGGQGIFAQKTGIDLEFKSIAGGANILLSATANTITIDTDAVINGANVGGGEEVFKQLNGSNLEFRTLQPGSNIVITQNTDTLTIDADNYIGRDLITTISYLDGTSYDLNVDNKVRFLEFNNGVTAQTFTTTIPTGTIETSAKYLLDNTNNSSSVTMTWPTAYKWDDIYPITGPLTLSASLIYRLELVKESNSTVYATITTESN